MNHLRRGGQDKEWELDDDTFAADIADKDHGSDAYDNLDDFNLDSDGEVEDPRSGWKNRMAYTSPGNSFRAYDSQWTLDHFDDNSRTNYIDTTRFPEDDLDDSNGIDAPAVDPSEPNIPLSPEQNAQEEEEEQDDNFQGLIRTVRGACLVYKRKTDDGTYDELWIYNVGDNVKTETRIRNGILSGTDINPNTHMSDDQTQKSKTTTIGNVQYLLISGLDQ